MKFESKKFLITLLAFVLITKNNILLKLLFNSLLATYEITQKFRLETRVNNVISYLDKV